MSGIKCPIQPELRDGMQTVLSDALIAIIGAHRDTIEYLQRAAVPICATQLFDDDLSDAALDLLRALAVALEQAIHSAAVRLKIGVATAYSGTALHVKKLLARQVGPYPDDIVALQLVRGATTAAAVVAMATTSLPEPDPREIIRRMFVRSLMYAAAAYAADRAAALAAAQAIESSCFNAVVRNSKQSEDPPRRHWDSDAFVNLYSGRCSTINGLLDPDSGSCRAYGGRVVQRLLEGALQPGDLGDATSEALCPEATAAERIQIAKRVGQKVVKKTSTLFKCPRCSARNCTYLEVHTRGLDEAADIHCTCVCGQAFRGN